MDATERTGGIPRLRWQLPVVMLVTVMVSYLDRMNISYAIPMIARDYGWSVAEIGKYGGLLMSVFYIGYGLANMFLSPVGEKFGARRSLIAVVILFSIFACLQAPVGMIFTALITVRILLGLGEGIHFPMLNMVTKRWFPMNERSRANGIWICGIFISMILAPWIVVPLAELWGWRAMFVVVGLAGSVVSVPLIFLFIHNTPDDHPQITEAEKQYIEAGMEQDEPETSSFWEGVKVFARKPAYWVALLGGIINNIVAHGLLSWMPTYFTEGRGLEFGELTYATSIPYVFSLFGVLLWSYLGDKTNRRAYVAGAGFFGAAICAYFAATAPTITWVVALFALTILINVAYASNEFALIQRVVPQKQTATGVGFYNGVAMMVGGGLGPVIVGGVVSATGNYTAGILSLTVLCAIGGVVLLILGRLIKY
jgi:sugar phosphate permease